MTVAIPQSKTKEVCYPTSDGKPMAETEIHLHQMFYLINALGARYADNPDVYVCGNNFLYYKKGIPAAVVSPDCYVVFGVPKIVRDTFKVWEENGRTPDVVFEITSKTTKQEDINTKRPMYESELRVSEYFLFDPTGDYLHPRLQGYRLNVGRYESIPLVEGRMRSEQLGLDLVQEGNTLRLYDPVKDEVLMSPLEAMQRAVLEAKRADLEAYKAELQAHRAQQEAQRAEQEAQRANEEAQRAEAADRRAEQESQRAEQEALRADNSDAENARLRAIIVALQSGR